MTQASAKAASRWPRPRFTLGALLILILLCALPLAYVAYRRAHNEARKDAFESLTAKGFLFELQLAQPMSKSSTPSSPERWWRSLVKADVVPLFTSVRISDSRSGTAKTSDDDLLRLAAFPEITAISIENAQDISDRGMEVVGKLPRLESLFVLQSPKVTSQFLEIAPPLKGLHLEVQFRAADTPALQKQTQLEFLKISNAPLTDEDLSFLSHCSQLDTLQLIGIPAKGAFLAEIDPNAPMHFLTISGAPLTDKNAGHLANCPRLVDINLSWTPLTGEFLPPAGAWPMIQRLDLQGTRFSEAGKHKLAQIVVPWHVTYPSNWNSLDMSRYGAAKPPPDFTLNSLFADEAKANSIAVPVFYPPNFQPPRINQCPIELMTEVSRLFEMAKEEHAKWKASGQGY
jgi:hypothetical protein